jgi:RNA polymerase sigma-70 factor (ECF subfamily)
MDRSEVGTVQKAASGSRKAFKSLFTQHFQAVYNYALSLSRDPALAEDLTQEAFIRAHANLSKLGPPWNFRAWIFRLTRNYFIDLTRVEREEVKFEDEFKNRSPLPGPEKEAQKMDAAEQIQATLNNLQPNYREILVLREINQFSYAEIGEILEISGSNVKVTLHRARKSFQEAFGIQLILDDPSGDCLQITDLLGAVHDGEASLNQKQLVKKHLQECPECRKRREQLIAQSLVFGAWVPVIPPASLSRKILQKTIGQAPPAPPRKSGVDLPLGAAGAGTAVLAAGAWLIYTLLFNTRSLLPNFPGNHLLQQTPITITFPTYTPPSSPEPTLQPTPDVSPDPGASAPAADRCQPFDLDEVSLVLLGLRPDTQQLPLYLKIPGGVPGLGLESADPEAMGYSAQLGDFEAYQCGLQGFEDRLYCMFELPESAPGRGWDLKVFRGGCPEPVYSQSMVSIPEPSKANNPVCSKDLDPDDCAAAGGEMSSGAAAAPHCLCP